MFGSRECDERIKVFEDTMRLCETDSELKEAIRRSVSEQTVIYGETELPSAKPAFSEPAGITVSKKRSFEAAAAYKGKKVCLLNFASATNPGGGVVNGASAQEECLCRCSTLYPCISDGKTSSAFHSMHRSMLRSGELDALYNDDCIYTPGVVVLKSDEALPRLLPKEQRYTVDIITCAAPNLREKPSNSMNPGSGSKKAVISDAELKKLHARRADRILTLAGQHNAEVVILGAFGCGAFRNPPMTVAEGMREAVLAHRNDFETVEFAIYCSAHDTPNYTAFSSVFGKI